MDERVKFVARLLEGEKMTVLCKEFGISLKTGYKVFNRYKELGIDGLHDQSRRPLRPNAQQCRTDPRNVPTPVDSFSQLHPWRFSPVLLGC